MVSKCVAKFAARYQRRAAAGACTQLLVVVHSSHMFRCVLLFEQMRWRMAWNSVLRCSVACLCI